MDDGTEASRCVVTVEDYKKLSKFSSLLCKLEVSNCWVVYDSDVSVDGETRLSWGMYTQVYIAVERVDTLIENAMNKAMKAVRW